MEFFTQAIDVLKVLIMAVGAGLGAWGSTSWRATEMTIPVQRAKA